MQPTSQEELAQAAQVAPPGAKKEPKPVGRPKMTAAEKAEKMLEKALKGEGKFAKKNAEKDQEEEGSEDE